MKHLLYLAIGIFATATFAQDNSQEDIWFKFQTPVSEAVIESENADTPFILKDKNGTPTNYTIPVGFEAISDSSISDVVIDIKHISAKYDKKGSQIIYLSGKVNLSCCYNGEMSMDFYDADDNLVQKARTDEFGSFKLKSINGNMFTIKGDKIKFNFTKVKTFDLNADVRFASIVKTNKSLGSEEKTVQETTNTPKEIVTNKGSK